MNTVGERLKHARSVKNYTQTDICYHVIGLSRSNFSRIEKDEINPSA